MFEWSHGFPLSLGMVVGEEKVTGGKWQVEKYLPLAICHL